MARITKDGDQGRKAQRSRPRFVAPNAQFATVIVGKSETRFVVHESLLTHYSKFFRAALTGKFKEAKEKTVKLAKDDEETFEFFVHWLYHQRFPDASKDDNEGLVQSWSDKGHIGSHPNHFVYLYIFADRYDVPKLRLQTLDGLICLFKDTDKWLPGAPAIDAAFKDLPASSPMRRLLVDLYCCYGDPSNYNNLEEYANGTFLQGLWCRFAEVCFKSQEDQVPIKWEFELCDYHEHEDEKERKSCEAKRKNE